MIRYPEIAAEIPAVISEKGGLHVLECPFAWIRMLHIFKLGNNRISTQRSIVTKSGFLEVPANVDFFEVPLRG